MNFTKEENLRIHQSSYLTFYLGSSIFAFDVSRIQEILKMKPITRIPRAPDYISGVINLRGSVLPVIDVRIKFGMPTKASDENTCIIVVNTNIDGQKLKLGALVDNVIAVQDISPYQIENTPSLGSTFNPGFVDGLVKLDEQFILLANIDQMFSSDYSQLLADPEKENSNRHNE